MDRSRPGVLKEAKLNEALLKLLCLDSVSVHTVRSTVNYNRLLIFTRKIQVVDDTWPRALQVSQNMECAVSVPR
jgi:hypothetical protein